MKNNSSIIVSISNIKDLDNITADTKYINIDITNPDKRIVNYFIKNGEDYKYSDSVQNNTGYNYVTYNSFVNAEAIIDKIYTSMPKGLTELEIARYLYIKLGSYLSSDINANIKKTELYNLNLITSINNIWGSLSSGRTNDITSSKLYYYLCRKLGIEASIIIDDDTKTAYTKLDINNQVLITDLYEDIPFIWANMETTHFATYNDDLELDKRIKYIKNKYNNYYLDKILKDIDYTKEDCVWEILTKTDNLLNVSQIGPFELSIIYKYIFDKYCPNYNIKINNLFLNSNNKLHFVLISYNDLYYSYNYKKKAFAEISKNEIIENLNDGKIGLYLDECIPNIGNN